MFLLALCVIVSVIQSLPLGFHPACEQLIEANHQGVMIVEKDEALIYTETSSLFSGHKWVW